MRKIFALIIAIVMIAVLAPFATAGSAKRVEPETSSSISYQRCLDNGNTQIRFEFANPSGTVQKFMVYHRYEGENIFFKELTLLNNSGSLSVQVGAGRAKEVRVDNYTQAKVLFHMDVRAMECPVVAEKN